MKYLEDNRIIPPSQYGFRKGKGTQLAIASIYETICLSQRSKFQANVVCRDVSKAIDKIWHNGLKFKILNLSLPDIMEKVLCSFLTDRTARNKWEGLIGPRFLIHSGVPQGSILYPSLYIFYMADIPPPGPSCEDYGFADDITQIIIYPHKSRRMLAIRTKREIERLKSYEKNWKIRTNKGIFAIISVSKSKPCEVLIDNNIVPFKKSAKILGLTISRTGINTHLKQRLGMAKRKKAKLKRFAALH